MSDINDRDRDDPFRRDDTSGATSGTSFGAGDRGLSDPATFGQRQDVKPGAISAPGAANRAGESESPAGEDRSTASARESLHDDRDRMGDAVRRETDAAKDAARSATDTVKDTAASVASSAKDRIAQEVEHGKEQATTSLGDFAAAVRKASDELGERDQSMGASLMREVASGIEQASNAIKGRNMQEIGESVAGFARRQPTTFLLGAVLAGVALGRFARASGEHRHEDAPTGGGYGSRGGDRDYSPTRAPTPRASSYGTGATGTASDLPSDVTASGTAGTGSSGGTSSGDTTGFGSGGAATTGGSNVR